MIKAGERVRVIGNSLYADEKTLGKVGVVVKVERKKVAGVNLDGDASDIVWYYNHKDLEVISEESHPQLLNSSYVEQVEDLLNQLRETIKSANLLHNIDVMKRMKAQADEYEKVTTALRSRITELESQKEEK